MTHQDHKNLIENAVISGTWADMGSGDGAFTLALSDLLGRAGEIYSIDIDSFSLSRQKNVFEEKFPHTNMHFLKEDFTKTLTLPKLDGIIAANAIHFTKNTAETLRLFRSYLKKKGRLIVVEYNVDHGNHWVPYPFSYQSFETLAKHAGFQRVEKLKTIPSMFLEEMYSAVAYT